MAFLIDSSVFISLERAGRPPTDFLEHVGEEQGAIAAITASELLHGVHRADGALRRSYRQVFVETVFEILPILPFTLDVARVHSLLWADLERAGMMIKSNDLLIAATALSHDLTLITGDQRHFSRINGLKMALW